MLDYVADELAATTGWRRVLEAYASLAPAPRSARTSALPTTGDVPESPETLGFVPRLSKVEGVDPEQLSSLHGKLIALGLLTFEVSGKSGMQYQVSPLGRRTLDRGIDDRSVDDRLSTPVDEKSDDAESAELEAA
jgi:hypothetical protein